MLLQCQLSSSAKRLPVSLQSDCGGTKEANRAENEREVASMHEETLPPLEGDCKYSILIFVW